MAVLNFLGGVKQLSDSNGNPLAGGKVYFFDVGTATPKTSYTTSALATANAHPVVLDANGRANIWINGNADVTVRTSSDVLVYTESGINPDALAESDNFNLLPNGSFEINTAADSKTPDSWTLTETGTALLDETDQRNGIKALKFTSAGSGGGGVETTTAFAVTEGRTYQVSWSQKGTANVRNIVRVDWKDSAGSALSTSTLYDEQTANPTSWTRLARMATPPTDARFAKLELVGCDASNANAGSTWFDDVIMSAPQVPTGTSVQVVSYDVNNVPASGVYVPPDGKSGLGLANNGTDAEHDIDIAVGFIQDSTGAALIRLTVALTKRIDANWSAGDDAGGFPSGLTLANATWYHVFLIMTATGTVDAGFDTSTSATNLLSDATGYTYYARVGSVLTDGSANILAFHQFGRSVMWDSPTMEYDTSALGATAALVALKVPPDYQVRALMNVIVSAAATRNVYISSPSSTDVAPADNAAPLFTIAYRGNLTGAQVLAVTNTSKQVRVRSSDASTTLRIATLGWDEL